MEMETEKRTVEIYGTLGPACEDEDVLYRMLVNGMTGIRINLSHTALAEAAPGLARVRRAAERAGRPCRILLDMQGPELRIGALEAPMALEAGDTVRLGEGGVPLAREIAAALRPGQQALLDDGTIALLVRTADGSGAEAEVIRGGLLKSRKSIALPGTEVWLPAVSEKDRTDLASAAELGADGVMQPFVRSPEDLKEVRSALEEAGCPGLRLLAKIENRAGVRMLPELLPLSDEIVIARGDLGNAVPLWELPGVQKKISAACREAGVPFMIVNQMLASMEASPVPTRAEVSDIFNAVLDGAASVMVTGETATGRNPADVIGYLARTTAAALAYLAERG